jgi:hypothetical protein
MFRDKTATMRLCHEAMLLAKLKHPNIIAMKVSIIRHSRATLPQIAKCGTGSEYAILFSTFHIHLSRCPRFRDSRRRTLVDTCSWRSTLQAAASISVCTSNIVYG